MADDFEDFVAERGDKLEIVHAVMRFATDPKAPHTKARKKSRAISLAPGEFTLNEAATGVAKLVSIGGQPRGDLALVVKGMAGIEHNWTSYRWLAARELKGRASGKVFAWVLRPTEDYLRTVSYVDELEHREVEWMDDDLADYFETANAMDEAVRNERDSWTERPTLPPAWDAVPAEHSDFAVEALVDAEEAVRQQIVQALGEAAASIAGAQEFVMNRLLSQLATHGVELTPPLGIPTLVDGIDWRRWVEIYQRGG